MEATDEFVKSASTEEKVSLDSLVQGESLTPDTYDGMFEADDTPMFDGVVQTAEPRGEKKLNGISANPTEAYEDMENKKRFIRNLNPEYKAQAVYAAMLKNREQYPNVPQVGHAKRIFLRKLERDAKKGSVGNILQWAASSKKTRLSVSVITPYKC